MIEYLVLHGLWTLAILALLWILRSAPPKLRLYISFLGMILWLVPLPLVVIPVPVSDAFVQERFLVFDRPADTTTPVVAELEAVVPENSYYKFWGVVLLIAMGLQLWRRDLARHRRELRALAERARDDEAYRRALGLPDRVSLRIIPGSDAMTTGIWRPVIWLGEDHLNGEEAEVAVLHEWVHVLNRDNLWLWLTHFLDRLFWWNPLVGLLSKKARLYIEMNCDQVCGRRMGAERYRGVLARMLLKSAGLRVNPRPLTASVFSNRRENMLRIEMIGRNFPMKFKYVLTLTLFLGFTGLLLAFPKPVFTGNQETNTWTGDENAVARVGQPGVNPPTFTKKISPVYPERALKTKLQGYVILEVILRKDGVVDDIKVLRELGKGKFGFEDSAIEAVSQWEFKPGTVEGKPADVRMTLKIDFVLREDHIPVAISEWFAGENDRNQIQEPRAYVDKTYLNKIDDGVKLTIPVVVQINAQGELISFEIDDEALAQFAYPDRIREHTEQALAHYTWTSASLDGAHMDTELKLNVATVLVK